MSREDDICEYALSQIGVPFVLGRRIPFVALDCVGLLLVVARALDIPLQDPGAYGLRDLVALDAHRQALDCGFIEKEVQSAERGDVVRLAINSRFPIHFGIVIGDLVVHACDRNKQVTLKTYTNSLDSRTRGVYQWPH